MRAASESKYEGASDSALLGVGDGDLSLGIMALPFQGVGTPAKRFMRIHAYRVD
jgi:hypothetical protein